MKAALLKLDETLEKLTTYLLWIIGVPFFSMLMIEVIARKLFNHSLFGVYELAGFLATWVSMMGAYLAYKKGEMAKLSYVLDKLSPKGRHRLLVVNKILVLIALICLVISGVIFISNPAVANQKAVAFNISVIYAYVGIPIGLFFIAFDTVLQLFLKGITEIDFEEGLE